MSWNLVDMNDIPRPHILFRFGPKTWKSLVIGTYPQKLYCHKTHLGPLGVKYHWLHGKILMGFFIGGSWLHFYKCRFCNFRAAYFRNSQELQFQSENYNSTWVWFVKQAHTSQKYVPLLELSWTQDIQIGNTDLWTQSWSFSRF